MDISLLPTLSDLALEMPPRVGALAQEGDQLEDKVRALLDAFEQKRTLAQEMFTQVQDALSAFREHADELKGRFASSADEVDAASKSGQDALSEGAQGLDSAASQAGGEMESLTASLTDAAGEAASAQEQATAGVHAVDERLATGGEALQSATETVAGETDALVQAADALRARVAEGSDALQQKMGELLMRAQGRIGELMSRLAELQGNHEDALGREAAHLETRRDELVQAVRSRIEDGIARPTAEAVDTVRAAFVAWGQDLQQCEARTHAAREAVAEGCDAVRTVSDPLPAVVEQVKGAAERAGLNFG